MLLLLLLLSLLLAASGRRERINSREYFMWAPPPSRKLSSFSVYNRNCSVLSFLLNRPLKYVHIIAVAMTYNYFLGEQLLSRSTLSLPQGDFDSHFVSFSLKESSKKNWIFKNKKSNKTVRSSEESDHCILIIWDASRKIVTIYLIK